MLANILGTAIAAAVGFLVALANYFFSKKMLLQAPEKYHISSVLRQVLQVGYLVAVYFIGDNINIADTMYLLVGAAVGMTVPMMIFTKKLLSLNEAQKTKKEDKADG